MNRAGPEDATSATQTGQDGREAFCRCEILICMVGSSQDLSGKLHMSLLNTLVDEIRGTQRASRGGVTVQTQI